VFLKERAGIHQLQCKSKIYAQCTIFPLLTGNRLELSPRSFRVTDADMNSPFIQTIAHANKLNPEISIETSILPQLIPTLSFRSLSDNFQQLLATFVTPMPENVPASLRARYHGVAQVVAFELHLAASKFPEIWLTEFVEEASVPVSPTMGDGVSIPILPSSTKRRKDATGRFALPAPPERSARQGLLTDALARSTISGTTDLTTDASSESVLRRFTRLTKPLAAQKMSTARNMNHWQTGSDPSTYDFLTAWKADDRFTELAQMSALQRARIQQQEKSLAKKQLRESQRFLASQQSQQIGSQLPWDTQPLSQMQSEIVRVPASQALLKQALASQREQQHTQMQTQVLGGDLQTSVNDSEMASGVSQPPKKKKRTKGF